MGVEYSPVPTPGLNASGESIPPRSFVKAGSGDEVEVTVGSSTAMIQVATAGKPDGSSGAYFVTGPGTAASAGQVALYSPVTPVWVKFSSAPSGTECGPVSGSWEASDEGTGFYLIRYNAATGLGLVVARSGQADPGTTTTAVGACACTTAPGIIDPTVDGFAHKLAYRWKRPGLMAILNAIDGFDVESEPVAVWNTATPSNSYISDDITRTVTVGEGEEAEEVEDVYVLTVTEDATFKWKLNVSIKSGAAPNCPDQLDFTEVLAVTHAPQPATSQAVVLYGPETKTSEDDTDELAYIDPPRCGGCLVPVSSTIDCGGYILPEYVQFNSVVAGAATIMKFYDRCSFEVSPGVLRNECTWIGDSAEFCDDYAVILDCDEATFNGPLESAFILRDIPFTIGAEPGSLEWELMINLRYNFANTYRATVLPGDIAGVVNSGAVTLNLVGSGNPLGCLGDTISPPASITVNFI